MAQAAYVGAAGALHAGWAVSGNTSRSKGRRGQQDARALLTARDWSVAELNSGTAVADMWACDLASGRTYCVEVKNTTAITLAHRRQAMRQAEAARMPWLLLSRIAGTSSWLVQRQGERPVVWHQEG